MSHMMIIYFCLTTLPCFGTCFIARDWIRQRNDTTTNIGGQTNALQCNVYVMLLWEKYKMKNGKWTSDCFQFVYFSFTVTVIFAFFFAVVRCTVYLRVHSQCGTKSNYHQEWKKKVTREYFVFFSNQKNKECHWMCSFSEMQMIVYVIQFKVKWRYGKVRQGKRMKCCVHIVKHTNT